MKHVRRHTERRCSMRTVTRVLLMSPTTPVPAARSLADGLACRVDDVGRRRDPDACRRSDDQRRGPTRRTTPPAAPVPRMYDSSRWVWALTSAGQDRERADRRRAAAPRRRRRVPDAAAATIAPAVDRHPAVARSAGRRSAAPRRARWTIIASAVEARFLLRRGPGRVAVDFRRAAGVAVGARHCQVQACAAPRARGRSARPGPRSACCGAGR